MSGEQAQQPLNNNPQSGQDVEKTDSVLFEGVLDQINEVAYKSLDQNRSENVRRSVIDAKRKDNSRVLDRTKAINKLLDSLRPFVFTQDLESLIGSYEAWLKSQDLSGLDSETIKRTAVNVSLLDDEGNLRHDVNQGSFVCQRNAEKEKKRIQYLLFDKDINGHKPQDFDLTMPQKAHKWVLDCFDEMIHEPAFYQDCKKRQQCTRSNTQAAAPQKPSNLKPSKYIINQLITSAYNSAEFMYFITQFLDNELACYERKLNTTPVSQSPETHNANQSHQQAVAPLEHSNIQRVLNSKRVNKKLISPKRALELKSIVCHLIGFNARKNPQAQQLKNYYLKRYLQPEGYLKKDEAGKRHFYLRNNFSRNLVNEPQSICDITRHLVTRINDNNDENAYQQLNAMFDQPTLGETVFMQTLQKYPDKAAKVVNILSQLPETSKKTNYMNAFINKGWSKSRNQRIDAFLNNDSFYRVCERLYQDGQLPKNATVYKAIQRNPLKAKHSDQTTTPKELPDKWQSSVSALSDHKTQNGAGRSYSYSQLADNHGLISSAYEGKQPESLGRRNTI